MDNNILKYLTTRNIIFFIMLIILIVFISKIQDIAIMFFASFVISCSLNPLVDKLEEKIKNRNLATLGVLGSAIILVLSVITPVIFLLSHEVKQFSTTIPKIFSNFHLFIKDSPYLERFKLFDIDWQGILSTVSTYTSDIMNEIINIGLNLSSALIYLIVSFIIIYYLIADKDLIRKTFLRLFPSTMRERSGEIYDIISKKIGGYIIALLTTIAWVGVVMIVGLLLFKVNYAVLLGLITAIFDIVPIVGPLIALTICLIAVSSSGWGAVAAVILVYIIAQVTENNIVRPFVFGKFLDIHPILIFFFLFVTAKFLGATGVIFAPAIAATVSVLIEEVYMKNIE